MTVYDTILIRTIMRWLSLVVLRLTGWTPSGKVPIYRKYVLIAAPHTSNWDFLYILCFAFHFRIKLLIMMKSTWFFWPLGPVFKWLGALPVDRSQSNNMVSRSIEAFRQTDAMVLVVPPSGTRKKVLYWKSGFYYIAHGAKVPIVMGFLDYRRKVGGFGPSFHPTGMISEDIAAIRSFYRGITGRYPLQESRVLISPSASAME